MTVEGRTKLTQTKLLFYDSMFHFPPKIEQSILGYCSESKSRTPGDVRESMSETLSAAPKSAASEERHQSDAGRLGERRQKLSGPWLRRHQRNGDKSVLQAEHKSGLKYGFKWLIIHVRNKHQPRIGRNEPFIKMKIFELVNVRRKLFRQRWENKNGFPPPR
ncbi:hypothetical protein CEXT_151341 [Caerostris extrusa]|uniref:Uncharacterized protein n=1 Tax=Caerostris extrusa TaxID=172846 RepID=A0AAV4S2C7_CAEEX|nr:hypothetical protein CEXT_151341 [Caerostris extrusa]